MVKEAFLSFGDARYRFPHKNIPIGFFWKKFKSLFRFQYPVTWGSQSEVVLFRGGRPLALPLATPLFKLLICRVLKQVNSLLFMKTVTISERSKIPPISAVLQALLKVVWYY